MIIFMYLFITKLQVEGLDYLLLPPRRLTIMGIITRLLPDPYRFHLLFQVLLMGVEPILLRCFVPAMPTSQRFPISILLLLLLLQVF